jgi:hypothetical protein
MQTPEPRKKIPYKKIIIPNFTSPWREKNGISGIITDTLLRAVIYEKSVVEIKDYRSMSSFKQ